MKAKWRAFVDDGQTGVALLTYLSKAFDFLNQDLLISKLAAQCFSYESQFYSKLSNGSETKN